VEYHGFATTHESCPQKRLVVINEVSLGIGQEIKKKKGHIHKSDPRDDVAPIFQYFFGPGRPNEGLPRLTRDEMFTG
jgi:hypothetical protein